MIPKALHNEINFKGTKTTPDVNFNRQGTLILKGKSYGENVSSIYDPLIEWVGSLDTPEVKVDMMLEYFNITSCKLLFRLLSEIDNKKDVDEFVINWFYENDDEDAMDTGRIFEESLVKAKFNYRLQ